MTVSIVKPTVGGDSGVWGDEINAALDALVAGINNLQGLLGSSYLTASAITSLLAGYASPAQITALTAQLGTLAPILEPAASYTYNGDGTVATETINGVATTYAYNGDGTVHTATRGGVTRTFTYNSDGTIASVA